LTKYGEDVIRKELVDKFVDKHSIEKLLEVFTARGSTDEILERITPMIHSEIGKERIERIEGII